MRIFLLVAVFLMGLFQPIQAGLNATIARSTGSRFQAGWTNGLVNAMLLTLVLLLVYLVAGRGTLSLAGIRATPWWAYLGGAIGAGIVVTQLSAAPVLGAGLLIAMFVAGQCVGSVLADTVGMPGYTKKPLELTPLIGLSLVIVGVVLVARPWQGSPTPGS